MLYLVTEHVVVCINVFLFFELKLLPVLVFLFILFQILLELFIYVIVCTNSFVSCYFAVFTKKKQRCSFFTDTNYLFNNSNYYLSYTIGTTLYVYILFSNSRYQHYYYYYCYCCHHHLHHQYQVPMQHQKMQHLKLPFFHQVLLFFLQIHHEY